jgi:hypothetical protein
VLMDVGIMRHSCQNPDHQAWRSSISVFEYSRNSNFINMRFRHFTSELVRGNSNLRGSLPYQTVFDSPKVARIDAKHRDLPPGFRN